MSTRRWPCLLIAGIAAQLLFSGGIARAAIISSSPSFPPIGAPFASLSGVTCFPGAPGGGVCVVPGSLSFTSLDTPTFDASGEHVTGDATYNGTLTNLSQVPIGPITLTGTIGMGIEGRMSATETGTWNTDLDSLSLTGTVLGHTLTAGLGASASAGTASVEPVTGQSNLFQISSFFDVFVDLTLDTPVPLQATLGPIRVALAPIPEPASLSLVWLGILALAAARRRIGSSA